MNPNVTKALLGVVTAVTAATVLSKVLKESNFSDILKDITIDLDAFTPREEKVINPNGEDFTVKSEYVRVDETYDEYDQPSKASNRSQATL